MGKRRTLIEADIQRRLDEALTQDDRIKGTRDYTYTFDRESVIVGFTVDTIFGAVPTERRFEIGSQVPSLR